LNTLYPLQELVFLEEDSPRFVLLLHFESHFAVQIAVECLVNDAFEIGKTRAPNLLKEPCPSSFIIEKRLRTREASPEVELTVVEAVQGPASTCDFWAQSA